MRAKIGDYVTGSHFGRPFTGRIWKAQVNTPFGHRTQTVIELDSPLNMGDGNTVSRLTWPIRNPQFTTARLAESY